MGYRRHHALVVTGAVYDDVARAYHLAKTVFAHHSLSTLVSAVTAGKACWSFLIAPDGVNEGSDISTAADTARAVLIDWLRSQQDPSGASPLAWVEVVFGDDLGHTTVTDDSDADRRWQR